MPTPIAHALAGVAAGCLVRVSAALVTPGRALKGPLVRMEHGRAFAVLAFLGMLPDADLLVGMHRTATHSAGAALIAGGIGWALVREGRLPTALAVAAAYGSHALLDWLGTDPAAPYGIMAWWPWTDDFHLSGRPLFMRICREYWLPDCWRNNILAFGREMLVLVPVTSAAVFFAVRLPRRTRRT